MTLWNALSPDEARHKSSAICARLRKAVQDGQLRPGDPLPSQRTLARRLGVSLGTVTRALAEAHRTGLVRSERGRGSFLRDPDGGELGFGKLRAPRRELITMEDNVPPRLAREDPQALSWALEEIRRDAEATVALQADWHHVAARYDATARAWLRRLGPPLDRHPALLCHGVQQAACAALTGLLSPGDSLLVAELTSPGVKALAAHLGLTLAPVRQDAEGLDPDDLERQALRHRARTLYLNPTLGSPLTTILSPARREAIARVVRRRGLQLIEEESAAFLLENPPVPLARRLPEQTVFLGDTTAVLGLAARVVFVVAPPRLREAVSAALSATSWMALPLAAEIAHRWITSDRAAELRRARRDELARRNRIAERLLRDFRPRQHPYSQHLWLPLASRLPPAQVVQQAREQGVLVNAAAWFWARRTAPPPGLRVCLGAPDAGDVERGLSALVAALDALQSAGGMQARRQRNRRTG